MASSCSVAFLGGTTTAAAIPSMDVGPIGLAKKLLGVGLAVEYAKPKSSFSFVFVCFDYVSLCFVVVVTAIPSAS